VPLPPHNNPLQAAEQRQTIRSSRVGQKLGNVVHRFETCHRIHSNERTARARDNSQGWPIRRNDNGSRITSVRQRYITLPEYVILCLFGIGLHSRESVVQFKFFRLVLSAKKYCARIFKF